MIAKIWRTTNLASTHHSYRLKKKKEEERKKKVAILLLRRERERMLCTWRNCGVGEGKKGRENKKGYIFFSLSFFHFPLSLFFFCVFFLCQMANE